MADRPDDVGPSAPDLVEGEPQAAARQLVGVIVLAVGGLMHLMVGGFYVASGLVGPGWAVALLAVVWVGLAVVVWAWRRRRPIAALLLPFVAAFVWWALISAGDRWLGWTA